MKILIVDDEKISRKILGVRLKDLGECIAADSSQKALKAFDRAVEEKKPFDLVTLDVSMPLMDGPKVLARIRKKEAGLKIPKKDQVKIIMVTARMNMSTIKECIRLGCNGYLSKPVTRYQLLENLEKLGFDIPENMKTKNGRSHTHVVANIIERFYKGKIPLPVFPEIVQQVQDLFRDTTPSMEELAGVVEKDIVISGRMISIANSSLYKGVGKSETLNDAMVRLGLKAARSVISSVAARNLFDSKNKLLKGQLEKLWLHSFAVACMGKRLGDELKYENPETLFLMGIMHDIGKMLLLRAFADISPETSLEDQDLQTAIHEIHTTFGAALLKKLKFSRAFSQIAEFHHWEEFFDNSDPELMIINLADCLAHQMGIGDGGKNQGAVSADDLKGSSALNQLGLDPQRVVDIAQETKPAILEGASIF